MTYIQLLIQEIKREAESTIKLLERIPEDKFSWRPHEKSMSLIALAAHTAGLTEWPALIAKASELDLANHPKVVINHTQELVLIVIAGAKASEEALNTITENDLDREWTLRFGENIIKNLNKRDAIRTSALNHQIHHRGQLTVYLRLLNIPLPGLYGPSADEQ